MRPTLQRQPTEAVNWRHGAALRVPLVPTVPADRGVSRAERLTAVKDDKCIKNVFIIFAAVFSPTSSSSAQCVR